MTIKAVSQELARRNATDADVDFSSLDREMGEALAVLARDSGNLFSGVLNHLKAAASGVPEIFSDAAVREWVSQTEVKDAVKNAVRAVVLGNATDQIAFAILASQDEALRPAFSAAFEYAVAFVALSIFRILTPGDRLAQQRFDEVSAQLADLAKSAASAAPLNSLQRDLLDQEAAKAIDLLRKRRFFPGCEIATEAQALAERLSAGELSQASNAVRAPQEVASRSKRRSWRMIATSRRSQFRSSLPPPARMTKSTSVSRTAK
ncbi:hypothetical protein [Caulobacter endophyticus]|uniref:hypothetical protein n=1 Tax=Caulobacter endophyticus TaxID=2172652 RepID=UPI0011B1F039|nr:hypothetical protein [Caulobacter endophyticus]